MFNVVKTFWLKFTSKWSPATKPRLPTSTGEQPNHLKPRPSAMRGEDFYSRLENSDRGILPGKVSTRADELGANGDAAYAIGDYKKAAERYAQALSQRPNDAWYFQSLAEAVARIDLKTAGHWECQELALWLTAGGKWDVTVRLYRHALKLDSSIVDAHRRAQLFKVDSPGEGYVENPVFIVGCGHSGTSLMLALLSSHPKLHAIPQESALFLKPDSQLSQFLRRWDGDCLDGGKSRWIEKTPPHIFQIHRFLAFRPQAKFVLMLRDGRDVICSLKHRVGYQIVDDRIDRWVYDNLSAEAYWDHPQVKVVKYEDLVADSETTLRSIFDFLEEEFSPSVLDFHQTERRWYSDTIERPPSITNHDDHKKNRNWQINQPLFDGRGRWRTEMPEAEKEAFKKSKAQELLVRFGYADNADW